MTKIQSKVSNWMKKTNILFDFDEKRNSASLYRCFYYACRTRNHFTRKIVVVATFLNNTF